MYKPKIAIIGGGSSGLFLANLINDLDADIYLFEKNNKLGKKILASGNGKCNFSNVYDLKGKYNNEFANQIIEKFSVGKTLGVFQNLGLIYKNDDQGRCYPVSECASSVLDCLKQGLKNIKIMLDTEVKRVQLDHEKYNVEYNNKSDYFDYVICCSGSIASNLGSNKAYQYLDQSKIKLNKLKSSLAPVRVNEDVSSLKGIRIKCKLRLDDLEGDNYYNEEGEVLFKEDALSGIAVFNASSIINRESKKYKINLDLSSCLTEEELFKYFKKRSDDINNLFKGFLHDKIGEYILRRCNIKSNFLNDIQIKRIVKEIKKLSFNVKEVYPLKESQVCSGGICISEVNDRLELKKYPNVYVAGELLDIDGLSGGYNLQFAWSSAGVIFQDIRKKIGEKYGKKEK